MTIGQMLHHWLTKLDWYSTLFPRIPVPIQKQIETKINNYCRQHNVTFVSQNLNQAPKVEAEKRNEWSDRGADRKRGAGGGAGGGNGGGNGGGGSGQERSRERQNERYEARRAYRSRSREKDRGEHRHR